eukprot:4819087-Karenia_brevis.AAC.1
MKCEMYDDMYQVCSELQHFYERKGGVVFRLLIQKRELWEDFKKFDVHQLRASEVSSMFMLG